MTHASQTCTMSSRDNLPNRILDNTINLKAYENFFLLNFIFLFLFYFRILSHIFLWFRFIMIASLLWCVNSVWKYFFRNRVFLLQVLLWNIWMYWSQCPGCQCRSHSDLLLFWADLWCKSGTMKYVMIYTTSQCCTLTLLTFKGQIQLMTVVVGRAFAH